MSIQRLKEVIMKRDNISSHEANLRIIQARDALLNYLAIGDLDSAENICEEYFGLEPDYLMDLI